MPRAVGTRLRCPSAKCDTEPAAPIPETLNRVRRQAQQPHTSTRLPPDQALGALQRNLKCPSSPGLASPRRHAPRVATSLRELGKGRGLQAQGRQMREEPTSGWPGVLPGSGVALTPLAFVAVGVAPSRQGRATAQQRGAHGPLPAAAGLPGWHAGPVRHSVPASPRLGRGRNRQALRQYSTVGAGAISHRAANAAAPGCDGGGAGGGYGGGPGRRGDEGQREGEEVE